MATEEEKKEDHKHFEIIVNGRPKEVTASRLSFTDAVRLAFGQPNETTAYTITYKRGPKDNPEGTMSLGDSVEIKSGMVFNVTATDKS